ncbi:MmpS family transport accessory protein [Rhodococcus sp. Q]|uniref:MmpS family transport accessory protein n=1 Tax=Rhodococcus sp. Q TaxID=2502252 RepID=UPI0010FA4B98|nr:MmpS family transport accessory protein [Rhodococcus sp. Q]
MTDPNQPYPHGQNLPPAPKKRKIWPWIVVGIPVLLFGGCTVAMVSTVDNEEKATASSGAGAAEVGEQNPPAEAPDQGAPAPALPPLKAAEPSGKGKTVVYEVISDSGTLNSVTYFDENSAIQQESSPSAPWTKTVKNTSTFVIAGVTAQTDGTSVTCRVSIDGEVEDEQTATGQYALVSCTAGP